MDNQKSEWEASYRNKDNFVFYPHEEVIRFVSKYIRKRTGLEQFKPIYTTQASPAILDLGCGIGRHVIYAHEMGLDAYGVDLSEQAVSTAREWAVREGIPDAERRIVQSDIRKLPWSDGFFPFVVSHGVLDSMKFSIACEAIAEVRRVMEPGGLFYCDLVSGDDSAHDKEYDGEEIVGTAHEQGTVQSYFNYAKIVKLAGEHFDIAEAVLIRRENVVQRGYISRYHVVFRSK